MAKNGYAALVKQRTEGKTKRRKLDDYETPPESTNALLSFVKFKGDILEPACGSGRMVRALRSATGLKVVGFDIKGGHNFLERNKSFAGNIITNPPYRDGLAEAFARHALKLADGRVAMLVQSGFLWGGKRAAGLFASFVPEAVVILPDRIYFYEGAAKDAKPIDSQFFTHAWVVWPERSKRDKMQPGDTRIFWNGVAPF